MRRRFLICLFFAVLALRVGLAAEVSYTDILLSPASYLNRAVSMKGKFYYSNTERKSFDIKQGDSKIEVFYENLPRQKWAQILQQKNFSDAAVTVSGIVKQFNNTKNSYYIMATDVVIAGAQPTAAKPSGDGLQYTDILLSPASYLNRAVSMKGKFYYSNTERKSFDIKQGDSKIEVFYENLPRQKWAQILQPKNFSDAAVTVSGIVKQFNNTENSYYIMATDVVINP